MIGVVLNNVDVRSDSQYQYYTSYYTYYAPTGDESSYDAPSAKAPVLAEGKKEKQEDEDLY